MMTYHDNTIKYYDYHDDVMYSWSAPKYYCKSLRDVVSHKRKLWTTAVVIRSNKY